MNSLNPNYKTYKPTTSIFQYTHIADYLIAIYVERRERNPAFSIRSWTRQIGLNSASLFSAVLRKERRVSPVLTSRLLNFLDLDEKEKKYFGALVVFSGPRSQLKEEAVSEYLTYLKNRIREEEGGMGQPLTSEKLLKTVQTPLHST